MSQGPTNPTGAPNAWAHLATEAGHPEAVALDSLATIDAIGLLLIEDRRGLEAAHEHRGALSRLAEVFAATSMNGGDVVFVGAGTSGRLGVLEAAECPPTFGTEPRRIRAIMAGGADAVFRAVEGAEDDFEAGARDLGTVRDRDLVIGISASSVTHFVLGALEAARRVRATTALVTCAEASGLEDIADHLVALDTGPEVLAGSTRLKAGSATKAALNALTTAAMARLGKIYGPWMVDLREGSAKLRDRAVRIVAAAAEVDRAIAEEALEAAQGDLKTAIVATRLGLTTTVARERLASAGGHVRTTLEG